MFQLKNDSTLPKSPRRLCRRPSRIKCGRDSFVTFVKSVFLFFIVMTSVSAYALPSDKNQPVHITADTAHLDKSTGISIFQGRVKLTQGTSILTTDKLTVYLDKNNQLLKAVATAKLATYQTITDPHKPPFVATAQMIQYLPPQGEIILTGNAKAVQGPNTYAAPQITYQIQQETVVSSSSKQGRTRIVITPQSLQHPKSKS